MALFDFLKKTEKANSKAAQPEPQQSQSLRQPDDGWEARKKIVEETTDQSALFKIACADSDSRVCRAAVGKLTDQQYLAAIARDNAAKDWRCQVEAIERLEDTETLRHIVDTEKELTVKNAANTRLFTVIAKQQPKRAGGLVYSEAVQVARNKLSETREMMARLGVGGGYVMGLRNDGSVLSAGYDKDGRSNSKGWKNIAVLCGGGYFSAAVTRQGTVLAAGENTHGRCDVAGLRNVVTGSAGMNHFVAVHEDGSVSATGYNAYGQCDVSGWSNVIDVAAGDNHTIGITADGKALSAGDNDCGQCDVFGIENVIGAAAGLNHTLLLKSDGTVAALGHDAGGCLKVEQWSDIVAVAAGNHTSIGLKGDGTVVSAGFNENGETATEHWRDVAAIKANADITAGLKRDGTLLLTGKLCYESKMTHEVLYDLTDLAWNLFE